MKVKTNEPLKLKLPTFRVDGRLAAHLDENELLKCMNRHFACAVMGKAGSGKTSLVQGLLGTRTAFKRVFDQVFIFIPPNSRDSIKNSVFEKLPANQVYDNLNGETLRHAFQRVEENSRNEKTSLIVFDDVQQWFRHKEVEPLLLHMQNNRRHNRLSLIYIAQSYQKISRQVRMGLTHLFCFKLSKSNLDDIYDELGEISPQDWAGVLREYKRRLKSDPEGHPFLFIDTNHQKYFIDWDELQVDDELDVDVEPPSKVARTHT
jgi:hypothetical protein